MSSDVSVRVKDLGKCFHIYGKPLDRLRQLFGATHKPLYREFWALRGVSFDVNKGESVGIIGRNGSGKSTLLQMICGTLTPTEGDIEVNGRLAALLELGAGFNPEFTGRENVYMNAAILGLSRTEIDAKYDEIADFADIGDFLDQPVKTYSSGMYVRLAFAVQACIDPEILIVDEALAVGDEKFQRKCFARLEELKKNGTSILFVSHVAETIIELCDRALLLDHGERLVLGHPGETVRAYQKLIYAPRSAQEEMVGQLKALDAATRHDTSSGDDTAANRDGVTSLDVACLDNTACYDDSLIPETTVVYPAQGAEITEIVILDGANRQVNVLQHGEEYRFISRGRFLASCEHAHFGLHIRSISGLIVTGQRYPALGQSIDSVKDGSCFEVVFRFRMLLLPGTYFVGGGIWSGHDALCMHRIMDKLMFRIAPSRNQISFGIFDASGSEPILSIA
jgi:lipopolysaccharide transport system ATP-binding protein